MWWPLLGVATTLGEGAAGRGEGLGPQVNKSEEVFSEDYQMSDVQGGILLCDLSHDACDVPSDRMNDGQTPVKTLPSRNHCCRRYNIDN